MGQIKLTKNELRTQQRKLFQLEKYLPTLQLKKAMLQTEIVQALAEIEVCERLYASSQKKVEAFAALFSEPVGIPLEGIAKVQEVRKRYENIAGVEVPLFVGIEFESVEYDPFDTPPWLGAATLQLRAVIEAKARRVIALEKKEALEKELRMVSIRVNLFEKILIPRALGNIKKIRIFLGDQDLAAVSRAKAAKKKIEEKKEAFTG